MLGSIEEVGKRRGFTRRGFRRRPGKRSSNKVRQLRREARARALKQLGGKAPESKEQRRKLLRLTMQIFRELKKRKGVEEVSSVEEAVVELTEGVSVDEVVCGLLGRTGRDLTGAGLEEQGPLGNKMKRVMNALGDLDRECMEVRRELLRLGGRELFSDPGDFDLMVEATNAWNEAKGLLTKLSNALELEDL